MAAAILICVTALAFVFVVTQGIRSGQTVPSPSAVTGVKGTPRNVDMDALRERLDRGELSTHPAEFHHPAEMSE